MLPLLDDSLHAKDLRGRSIPSLDIDDQKDSAIWLDERYNWLQPTKLVASDAIFLC